MMVAWLTCVVAALLGGVRGGWVEVSHTGQSALEAMHMYDTYEPNPALHSFSIHPPLDQPTVRPVPHPLLREVTFIARRKP
jgi:hypothetical protein